MKYNICIGYDRNNRMPAYVLAESIMQKSSVSVNFMFLHRDMLREFTRLKTEKESTDFSISRFLVPHLYNYEGWTLFLDNDIIVDHDIKELFDLIDEKYSVMCVKHNQVCQAGKKFLNSNQFQYDKKNWSSVMFFNNKKCKKLTVDYVEKANGLDLHQFKWLDSESEIGSLPLEWNFLVENQNQTANIPKLIHYTNGGPYFKETENCDYSEKWKAVYKTINDVRTFF
jgi:lipopolysaccharide biosynthesis glycosyltransferase